MKFYKTLLMTIGLLWQRKRMSYQALKQMFDLDDAGLEALRIELIQVEQVAVDQDGEFLMWAGMTKAAASTTAPRAIAPLKPLAPMPETLPAVQAGAQAAAEATADVVPLPVKSLASDAERRPLTVMFCDLADSTALSTRLDPEDLQDVIRGYQETCTQIIQNYEGYVAKYMGDGILVYFGYPKSLERNAEQAVRTGLAIAEAMAGLNQTLGRDKGIELAVRIGIASGIVMVGEVVGEGLAQERTVIGEAPNMAARLQGVAERNGIVIGGLTKELTGDVFTYQDLGAHELKGISGRVQTWAVLGLRDDSAEAANQDKTDGQAVLPELVGRDEETGLLRRAWQSTKDEERGQVVTISGEAGIGKSVLIDGLKAEVRAAGLPGITFRCSPYHSSSTLYPVIEHYKRLAGWQPEDSAETRLAKLETMLEPYTLPLGEAVPLLAALLSLALPQDRYPPLALTPQQQKQQTQDAIIAMTLEAAERQPLLEMWEDLHWADPSTLELLGLLIEQVPTASLLLVLTARPEFVPPWPARSHITPITLNRLERPHSEALIARLAGEKPLPAEVVDHIVSKTDGVPLYVEELTKTILASDVLQDTGERFELIGPLASLSIPETLQESLMARLDRLPQVRELAQLGAVLGREFAYEMISGLSGIDESALQESLGQLVESELLYQRGRPPRAKYIFKHALVQDAAYQSLLRRSRQQYHEQVAQLLETRFPEIVETQPELVAHHYSEANEADRAVNYFQKAGDRAAHMLANKEAMDHLEKGLEVLGTLPDNAERAGRELNLLTTLGPVLIAAKGYAASEVEYTYRRAWELCQTLENTPQQFSALHGVWYVQYIRGELVHARAYAEQLVDMAKGQQDSGLNLAAHRALGYTLNFLGELKAARSCLEQVVTAYDPAIHGDYAFRHGGADPGVGALVQGAWADWALGYPDQAIRQSEKSIALARELTHPFSEAVALTLAAAVYQLRGERRVTQQYAEAVAGIAQEGGFALYVIWASIIKDWALDDQHLSAETVAEIRQCLDASRATGAGVLTPYWLTLLADVHGRLGETEEGLAVIAEALTEVARTSERFCEAELHRLKGQLLLEGEAANQPEAEACFHKAIEIAQSQAAKSWELRAATSLARLWQQQDKNRAARELLILVYEWFSEGFDTVDLKEAKALLDELALDEPLRSQPESERDF